MRSCAEGSAFSGRAGSDGSTFLLCQHRHLRRACWLGLAEGLAAIFKQVAVCREQIAKRTTHKASPRPLQAELAVKNQELAAATREAEKLLREISESTAVAEKEKHKVAVIVEAVSKKVGGGWRCWCARLG